MLDISANTQVAGATAIAITAADGWTTDKPIWLVENQAQWRNVDHAQGARCRRCQPNPALHAAALK